MRAFFLTNGYDETSLAHYCVEIMQRLPFAPFAFEDRLVPFLESLSTGKRIWRF
jgi:hypothetical protein